MTDDQRRPFLPDAQSSEPASQHRPRRHGLLTLFVLLLAAAAAVFALAGLLLGFSPRTHISPTGQDDADSDPSPAIVHHQDSVSNVPRLRDAAHYVLDLASWDYDSSPATREYHWTILDADFNPDGVYRPMMLINNQFPGPLVECNDGDTLVVHVANKAAKATSIHFHGLFQNGTNSMDGTVGVTQCPIAPNSTFTYRFQVHGQSGTYWYHAHHSAQASDGLLGPVVVHSKDERAVKHELGYASDTVIMVQDHYHNTTAELLVDYLQPDKENDEPVPDNALINGRGLRSCADFAGWRCDVSNASRPLLDVAAGARHRLRFINVGAFAEFQIQVDEHPFYVTEVDGTDVHPEAFHRLNILPAQRYSIVLEANATAGDAFWVRARMVTHCFTTKNPRLQPELRAVMRYVTPHAAPAPVRDPESREWPDAIEVQCRDLNTTILRPVTPVTPPPADDFLALRANFQIGAWRLSRGFFNDSSWRPNATSPSLHRFLDAPIAAQTGLGNGTAALSVNDRVFERQRELVLQTMGIRTVDIAINNFDDGAHPFHLHGHRLFVVAQGRSGYPPTAEQWPAYLAAHGGPRPANPLRRDTVSVEAYAWVVVRVVLDNPGLWTLHCHNTWHAEAGMVMQLLARADVVAGQEVPAPLRAMCALDGVRTGMRPDDDVWVGSF